MKRVSKGFVNTGRGCGRAGIAFFLAVALSAAMATCVCAAESPSVHCVFVEPVADCADGKPMVFNLDARRTGAFHEGREAGVRRVEDNRISGYDSISFRTAYLHNGNEVDFIDYYDDPWGPFDTIKDPLEPLNRAFFHFNDKLYFWFFKPAAQGYRSVVPEKARIGISNFFYNLGGPIRLVNCLLQGKGEEAGYEFVRLFVNTTLGLGGFLDVATHIEVEKYDEDFGQTLGVYGSGPLFYIHWPFLGPSSARDTVGLVGDSFLNPLSYLAPKYNAGIRTYDQINDISLAPGRYEDFKRSAIDPYVALRDMYFQNREDMIRR